MGNGVLFLEHSCSRLVCDICEYRVASSFSQQIFSLKEQNFDKQSLFHSQTLTCYNDPESHPFITDRELAYLKCEMGQTKRNNDLPPTPWLSILTSIPVWALALGLIGHDWIFYIMSADMPKYLKDVLKLPIEEIGLYSSLPYLGMWIVSLLSGFVSDLLIVNNVVTITNARKIFSTLGKCRMIIIRFLCFV